MKNNVMSVKNQIKYLKTLNGIAWVATGIFELFDNIPFLILTIISLSCSAFLMLKVQLSEKENEDEMASRNLSDARALTLMQMHIIFSGASIVLMIFVNFPIAHQIDWSRFIVPAFFIILGVEDLLTGMHFKKLEE